MKTNRFTSTLCLTVALVTICTLTAALSPAVGLGGTLDDIEFSSDIRLRWRWVDSATPGPLRSTYGEFIQRGLSLKHRFVFDIAYPLTKEIRVANRGQADLAVTEMRCFGCDTSERAFTLGGSEEIEIEVGLVDGWTGSRWLEVVSNDPVQATRKISLVVLE